MDDIAKRLARIEAYLFGPDSASKTPPALDDRLGHIERRMQSIDRMLTSQGQLQIQLYDNVEQLVRTAK